MIEPMDKEILTAEKDSFIVTLTGASLFGKIQDISLVNINLEGEVRREY